VHRAIAISALAVSLVVAAGCGASTTYDAADVKRAFATAGVRLTVQEDPQAAVAGSTNTRFNDAVQYAPKVLGHVSGETNDIAVFVFVRAKDAKVYERQTRRLYATIRAHPDRFPKSFRVGDPGVTRIGNVVVAWNKSKPDLSRRVTTAIAELR